MLGLAEAREKLELTAEDVADIQGFVSTDIGHDRTVLATQVSVAGRLLPPGTLFLDLSLPLTTGPVWVQLPGFEAAPLSAFGAALQRNALRARPQSFQTVASAWRDPAAGTSEPVIRTAADATAFVLLDLGLTLFAQQC